MMVAMMIRRPLSQELEGLLTKRFDKSQSVFEKKLGGLSNYIDRRLGEIESKCQALAEPTAQNEAVIQEIAAKKSGNEKCESSERSDSKAVAETTTTTIDNQIHEKLEARVQIFEERVDGKLNSFMTTSVKQSFEVAVEGAMTVFGQHVDERIHKIESELGMNEDCEDGKSLGGEMRDTG